MQDSGDNYGRLLAYVYLSDGSLFNAELIKRGYARWATKVKSMQLSSEKVGKIIGNKKSKIYHLPGQANYDKGKEENQVYFDCEEEAIKAGYRKAKR